MRPQLISATGSKISGTIAACAPSGLGEGGGIAIVFEGNADAENLGQIVDGIFSAPSGKEDWGR